MSTQTEPVELEVREWVTISAGWIADVCRAAIGASLGGPWGRSYERVEARKGLHLLPAGGRVALCGGRPAPERGNWERPEGEGPHAPDCGKCLARAERLAQGLPLKRAALAAWRDRQHQLYGPLPEDIEAIRREEEATTRYLEEHEREQERLWAENPRLKPYHLLTPEEREARDAEELAEIMADPVERAEWERIQRAKAEREAREEEMRARHAEMRALAQQNLARLR